MSEPNTFPKSKAESAPSAPTGFTRRFSILAGISLAAICTIAPITAIFARFLRPKQPAGSFGGMISIGGLQDIPEVNSPPKNYPQGKFWLLHQEKGLTALYSNCTHLECLFAWNTQKDAFVCPCHGSEFSCDGKILRGPAKRNLDTFPISIIDEKGKTLRLSDKNDILPIADIIKKRKEHNENAEKGATIPAVEIMVNTAKPHKKKETQLQ